MVGVVLLWPSSNHEARIYKYYTLKTLKKPFHRKCWSAPPLLFTISNILTCNASGLNMGKGGNTDFVSNNKYSHEKSRASWHGSQTSNRFCNPSPSKFDVEKFLESEADCTCSLQTTHYNWRNRAARGDG